MKSTMELPKHDLAVLTWTNQKHWIIDYCCLDRDTGERFWSEARAYGYEVMHWQELPDPTKREAP